MLMAAILDSAVVKVRKTWRPGRMILRMPKTTSITGVTGK